MKQLVNYDRWLSHQAAQHRAGFVLAVENLRWELPAGLGENWVCITWTDLGRQIEESIAVQSLPPGEMLLARHTLGFIREYLWSEIMSDERLELEDVALLKAFTKIGVACERKVVDLVRGVETVLANSGIAVDGFRLQERTFRNYTRTVYWGYLQVGVPPKQCGYPTLIAGIVGDEVHVWLESLPSGPAKEPMRRLGRSVEEVLQARTPGWRVMPTDDRGWPDVPVSFPLTKVLAAEDQQATLNAFVGRAMEDLKAVCLCGSICSELQKIVGSAGGVGAKLGEAEPEKEQAGGPGYEG